jgi:hypothetical protein
LAILDNASTPAVDPNASLIKQKPQLVHGVAPPAQPERFAQADAHGEGDGVERVEKVGPGGLEDGLAFVGCQRGEARPVLRLTTS